MLHPSDFYDYQRKASLHQLYHDESMLWLEMGLGKTPITLSTIVHRMVVGQVQKTLIFGPLRVIHGVWHREARKWSHTEHLRFSVTHGTEKERLAALFRDSDVYLCNYENMAWLAGMLMHYYISQGKPLPFQMVVYDEVTKVKNSQSVRIKGGKRNVIRKPAKLIGQMKGKKLKDLRTEGWFDDDLVAQGMLIPAEVEQVQLVGWRKIMGHFQYKTGLTGSPAPNGYLDIFGQFLVLDGGERLGEFISHYRDAYFVSDYQGWTYVPTDNGKAWIEYKISDITLKMDAADYLELPPVKFNDIMVDLPPNARKQYDEVERDMFTKLDDGTEIELFTRGSVSNKCLQFCNGSPYTDPITRDWVKLHDAKFEALDDIIEEANGKPVLVSYGFVPDALRIMERYKKLKPVNMTKAKAKDTEKIINDWNAGKIKLLVGHPASMGHGVDGLQESGDILVWFGLTHNLEYYMQMIARLKRQGRKGTLFVHRILCNDTLDLAVSDSLLRKEDDEAGLKRSIQRYRDGNASTIDKLNFM